MPAEPIAPIAPIAAVPATTTAAAVAAYHAAQPLPLTPSQAALSDAQATAAKTLDELALAGDPLAIAQLVREHQLRAPAQAGTAQHPPHAAGPTEPGKGQLVDEYD